MMRIFFCFMLLFLNNALHAEQMEEGIKVVEVSSIEGEQIYYMDANIEINLPKYMVDAIYNGIPLPLLIQVEVKEEENWWFNRSLVTVEQRYVLHYYPLRDVFKLNNLSSDSSTTQRTLEMALKKIGTIRHFPILDKEDFKTDKSLYGFLHLKIDVDALPKPLRTTALLGGNWDIGSEWKEWRLQ